MRRVTAPQGVTRPASLAKEGIDMASSRASWSLAVAGALFTAQLVVPSAATAAPPSSTGSVRVPLTGVFRLCDHDAHTFVPTVGDAQGLALISTTGNMVSAQVTLNYAPAERHYTVRLIQMPRRSSDDCGTSGAGVTAVGLDTDPLGNGAAR